MGQSGWIASAAATPTETVAGPMAMAFYVLLPIVLAVIHIFVSRFAWLNRIIPWYRWLSLGAGVSIAYVFLDVLPELNHAQAEIEHVGGPLVQFLENHVYLLALAGLAAFYGLEILATRSRRMNHCETGKNCTHTGIFWVHIGSFAIYNALIGNLLSDAETRGVISAALLGIALALHFLVNDRSLRSHHKAPYDRLGRWILAGALMSGWAIGQVAHLHEAAVAVVWAFVAGGIILNVLKEELPEDRESCFGTFTVGGAAYAALLLWL